MSTNIINGEKDNCNQKDDCQILTISLEQDFLQMLALFVWKNLANEDVFSLATVTVVLPNNRSVKAFKLKITKIIGTEICLPKIIAIKQFILVQPELMAMGDVDDVEEDHISDYQQNKESLQICILAKLVQSAQFILNVNGIDENFTIAYFMAKLINDFSIMNLDIEAIDEITSDCNSEKWQLTVKFLKYIFHHWQLVLKQCNSCTDIDNINFFAKKWQYCATQFDKKIVIAGVSNVYGVYRKLLMDTITKVPNAWFVMHGFNHIFAKDALNENNMDSLNLLKIHPQKNMLSLLQEMNIPYQDVKIFNNFLAEPVLNKDITALQDNKEYVINNIFAANLDFLNFESSKKLDNIELIECDSQAQEAKVIAAIVMEYLNIKNKTVTIVSNSRDLVLRVKQLLKNHNIFVDDARGQNLIHTCAGILFLKVVKLFTSAINSNKNDVYDIYLIIDVLKHPFVSSKQSEFLDRLYQLEKLLKTNLFFYQGMQSFLKDDSQDKNLVNYFRQDDEFIKKFHAVINKIDIIFSALNKKINNSSNKNFALKNYSFINVCKIVLDLYQFLLQDALLKEEDYEAAQQIVKLLKDYWRQMNFIEQESDYFQNEKQLIFLSEQLCFQDSSTITSFFSHFLAREEFRKTTQRSRVNIIEALEVSVIKTDITILTDLNENSWPSQNIENPWLTSKMLSQLGMPNDEYILNNYLTAFINSLFSENTFLTRAKRIGGHETIASRFVMQIKNFISTNKSFDYINKSACLHNPLQLLCSEKIQNEALQAFNNFIAPNPEMSFRPQKVTITDIVQLLNNPYAYYLNKILHLKPLTSFNFSLQEVSFNNSYFPAIKGIIYHNIMELLVNEKITCENNQDSAQLKKKIIAIKSQVLDHKAFDEDIKLVLNYTIDNLFEKWLQFLPDYNTQKSFTEKLGVITLENNIELVGKCDRIDIETVDNTIIAKIIDYKTGSLPPKKQILSGTQLQLMIEAVMAINYGFGIKIDKIDELALIKLSNLQKNFISGKLEAGSADNILSVSRQEIEHNLILVKNKIIEITNYYCKSKNPFIFNAAKANANLPENKIARM